MISLGLLRISRRLLAVNALLAALSVGFSVYIIGQITAAPSSPAPARPAMALAAVGSPVGDPVAASPALYSTIGSRNLFSPTRADTHKTDAALTIVGQLNLFGVALAGEHSIAYLEDPVSKRVFGYRLGDSVAGGVIRAIEADRVVLLKGEPEVVNTPSNSGKGQKIARCPTCRIALWSNYAGAGDAVRFVRVGTLNEPDRLPPDIHIFTASKQPWVVLPANTPAVEEYYDRTKHWPKESLERRDALIARARSK